MKVKIIDELDKKRDASIEQVTSAEERLSTEAKQLLLNSASEERLILKNAGLDGNIREIETVRGVNIERAGFEKDYGKRVFTEAEIKDTCHKYNLKLLPSRRFKGSIDPVLGMKIVEFFKKAGIDSSNYDAANNLYIMAPPSVFDLEMKPKPLVVDRDPVLFYRIARRNDVPMYVPIHKWGEDFTVFRRLSGVINYSFGTRMAFVTSIMWVVILSIFALFNFSPVHPGTLIFSAVLAAAIYMIYMSAKYSVENSKTTMFDNSKHLYSKDGWDQHFS